MKHNGVRIGISGWTYEDWRGTFYPEALTIKKELQHASSIFNSIEVNGTFYSLQRPHTFQKWYEETPSDFVFAIKGPKYVTHQRRLKDVEKPLANFFASGILALNEKLGPILWQLPPNLAFDAEHLETFLKLLPHTTEAASKLGKGHSEWMAERAFLKTDKNRPLRHALEVRNHSFVNKDFLALMKKYNVAIVLGDTAGRWPFIEENTGSIIYIRLHGDETVYPKGYTKSALQKWAKKIKQMTAITDAVFTFCDNDHKTAAPHNAMQLMAFAGLRAAGKKTSKPAANNRTVRKAARLNRAKNKALNGRRQIAR